MRDPKNLKQKKTDNQTLSPDAVWTIFPAFSVTECRDWIAQAEKAGFEQAGIEGPGGHRLRTEVRNNARLEIESPEWLAVLWGRIGKLVPEVDECQPLGAYRKLRFYRYQPGERFNLHTDGFKLGDRPGERSRLTCMVYLNDDFEGGRTWFPELDVRVEPRTGMVLLFRHLLSHAGETVLAGTKYVLRADLLYQAQTPGKEEE